MPYLSDLVPFRPGQVRNFYLLERKLIKFDDYDELICCEENSVDPDQLASNEASWSGSTLFSIVNIWFHTDWEYNQKTIQDLIEYREHSGSVVECLTRDRESAGFEPHRHHCLVVLEQDTFILA